MGLPGIHEWQHWLSLPLALIYFLALGANTLIVITVHHEHNLHQPMYQFLSILAIVDIGLATTIMPKILAIFWFDVKAISLPECFTQIYAVHCFIIMESGIFLCMAVDRYVAICHPLQYSSIVTEAFVVKATVFMVLRNVLLTIPVLIFRSVLRLNSTEAIVKALSTCSSHLILIFFFYTAIVVVSIAHLAGKAVPIFPVLLNVLNIVIPPALNPMVYALRAQELSIGFQRVFGLDKNVSQK
ncbi:unnamed protein product [Gulo gulo]|uniref:G-protein coupled receptors family 1 profile domain-containing protein n=1 Tax=Gulo gulo TaxID=48420 RepID=A0A9X9MBD5_GULGU|nr:unnamed protein product [Gulo gulo]